MKLSEAILLGDSLKKPYPAGFLSQGEGCALGGAILAVNGTYNYDRVEAVQRHWPWFTIENFDEVSALYWNVCEGKMTIEQLADYVRTIEPDDEQLRLEDIDAEAEQNATDASGYEVSR